MTKGSASWRLLGDDDLAAFEAFLGPQATAEDLTPAAVRSTATRSNASGAATVAKHFSALRGLAGAVGADAAIKTVRSARVARGEPLALDHDEWAWLLRMPDRRSRQGKRDLALLHLLGSAGLRRAEPPNVLVGDVDERRRSSDPRLRAAITRSTSWWVTVRYGMARPHLRHPARSGRARRDRRLGQG